MRNETNAKRQLKIRLDNSPRKCEEKKKENKSSQSQQHEKHASDFPKTIGENKTPGVSSFVVMKSPSRGSAKYIVQEYLGPKKIEKK